MPGQDFHPSDAFGDCLREGARLDHVAAAIDIREDRAVAGEGALLLVVVLQLKFDSLELGFPASECFLLMILLSKLLQLVFFVMNMSFENQYYFFR